MVVVALGLVAVAVVVVVIVVVVVGVAIGSSRARDHVGGSPGAIPDRVEGADRWVDAGLITADQAAAIAMFEASRRGPRARPRVSPAVEALAYLGGILLAVGAGMLLAQSWGDLGRGGRIAVLAVAAGLTGVVGVAVGEAEPVARRLRGFLWALSTAGIGGLAAVIAVDMADATGEPLALAVSGTVAVSAGVFWWLRDRPLQHLLSFAGLAVSVGVALALVTPTASAGAWIGCALWVLGAGWAALAWRRLVPPPLLGFALGAVLSLGAAAAIAGAFEWLAPLVGLATAIAWVGLGVALAERAALVPGAIGLFVYLPWTLGEFFGESFGAPAIAMLSGTLLLAVVLLLARSTRGRGARPWSRRLRATGPAHPGA